VKKSGKFFVYLVSCKTGAFYAGFTVDLKKRLELHNAGRGAKFLRGKGPVELVYAKEYRYLKNALKAEINLKKLKRGQKEKLAREYEKKFATNLG